MVALTAFVMMCVVVGVAIIAYLASHDEGDDHSEKTPAR